MASQERRARPQRKWRRQRTTARGSGAPGPSHIGFTRIPQAFGLRQSSATATPPRTWAVFCRVLANRTIKVSPRFSEGEPHHPDAEDHESQKPGPAFEGVCMQTKAPSRQQKVILDPVRLHRGINVKRMTLSTWAHAAQGDLYKRTKPLQFEEQFWQLPCHQSETTCQRYRQNRLLKAAVRLGLMLCFHSPVCKHGHDNIS